MQMTAAAAKRHSKTVGYIRVSSLDQNTERQLDGLKLDKVFTDKASGKDTKRPQLKAALEYLRDGDKLIVHSLDRLARNLVDLKNIVSELTARDVTIEFVKERLVFTNEDNAMSNLLLSVMGAFAEFERSLIRERQREGIELAKKAGVYKGRKPSLTPERVNELRKRVKAGEKKAARAREFKISRETLYTYLAA
jgi:DNA invertase Pin-like site-specific DNA recombinase